MKRFAALYRTLDRSTGTLDKRAALVAYFRAAPPLDAAWALYLLAGGKVASARMRIAASGELREWIAEAAGIADWLVADSYDHVGDLAETLALLLDDPASEAVDVSLAEWIEQRQLPSMRWAMRAISTPDSSASACCTNRCDTPTRRAPVSNLLKTRRSSKASVRHACTMQCLRTATS